MRQAFYKLFIFLIATSLAMASMQKAHAQRFSRQQKKELEIKEDSMKRFAYNIIFAEEGAERFRADSQFIRIFVRALKITNSFYYPFDSLQTISRLYAPDSSFRIITWEFKKDAYVYLQQGAIQMRTSDGSLKLYPLHDASMFTKNPLDSVRGPNNWIGAIYYRIIMKTYNNKKYYTLLGFDDFTISSTKKWMEVLTFNEENQPVFGGSYISFKEDTSKIPTKIRFNIEYKKDAVATFNYDPEMDLIIYDNLVSETNEPDKKDTYIPNGDYEGFRWDNGQWVHVDKVFNQALKDGQYPKDRTILDNNGNIDEQKLMEQSLKNQQKKLKPSQPPAPKKDGNNQPNEPL